MRIAVDLTPILPGGENGGAKIVALRLIKTLIEVSPKDYFILFATDKNFQELAYLRQKNVKIEKISLESLDTIMSKPKKKSLSINSRKKLRSIAKFLSLFLPQKFKARLKNDLKAYRYKRRNRDKIADVLFCPFTAPYYKRLELPIVTLVHDLQPIYYPYFFSSEDYLERVNNFNEACNHSAKIICYSNYVKKTIIENSNFDSENINVIYNSITVPTSSIKRKETYLLFRRYELTEEQYLLYPANYWLHKNHKILFTAFNIFCHKNPKSRLKLVCTGHSNEYQKELTQIVDQLGLSKRIIFPGYLSEGEFSSIIHGCKGVIYPSLYEGFGLPLLEAMAIGKLVACSDVTSMPEIVDNAALLFDPRKPEEIAEVIERMDNKQSSMKKFIRKGYQRASEFNTLTEMSLQYLDVLRSAAFSIKQSGKIASC